jgi:alkylated DNA repair dioxygenase AlkB
MARSASSDAKAPAAAQAALFGATPGGPAGLVYAAQFLSPDAEAGLLEAFSRLDFHAARYKGYTARRRVVSFGSSYDFSDTVLAPAPPIPAFLLPLRAQAAAWAGVPEITLNDALIAEYPPGTQLGWHRDVPDFEDVIGVSLAGACRMRFRPYPPGDDWRAHAFALALAPRSAYVLRGEARWRWQHMIPPTPALRYSITFRSRRKRGAARGGGRDAA